MGYDFRVLTGIVDHTARDALSLSTPQWGFAAQDRAGVRDPNAAPRQQPGHGGNFGSARRPSRTRTQLWLSGGYAVLSGICHKK